jgi:hypothetical protein
MAEQVGASGPTIGNIDLPDDLIAKYLGEAPDQGSDVATEDGEYEAPDAEDEDNLEDDETLSDDEDQAEGADEDEDEDGEDEDEEGEDESEDDLLADSRLSREEMDLIRSDPKLQKAYKGMQAALTKKTQAAAEKSREAEEERL